MTLWNLQQNVFMKSAQLTQPAALPRQFIFPQPLHTPSDTTGFNYTRESNPTRARLKQLLAALENGVDALAFSSGMAAVDAVMNLFAPGDHIITGNDLYGGSFRLFRNLNAKNGVEFTSVHTSKLEEIKAAIKPIPKPSFWKHRPTPQWKSVICVLSAK